MHKSILATVFGICIATFAFHSTANATLITSGEIQVLTPTTGRGNFSFLIGDSSVTGFFDEGSRLLRPGFEGSSFAGDHSTGSYIDMFYGYVDTSFVRWTSDSSTRTQLNTSAAGGALTRGQTVYDSPFVFEGSLCGAFLSNTSCDVGFPILTGHGIAEFFFQESIMDDGRHYFTPTKAKYTFTTIPEPASLALFCVGLIAFGVARRR